MIHSPDSEKEIVESAKADPEAFGRLYDIYYPQIFNYILRRTANKSLAEELTSNTFFKALDKLWTFKWRNLPFSAWLYRIASNEINSHYRFKKKSKIADVELELLTNLKSEELTDEQILCEENRNNNEKIKTRVLEEIYSLKPKYREVIVLRYFEDKSISDISAILIKSEGTIKSLLHRAIKKLQERFEELNLGEFRHE